MPDENMMRVWESNTDPIGGRRVLSPFNSPLFCFKLPVSNRLLFVVIVTQGKGTNDDVILSCCLHYCEENFVNRLATGMGAKRSLEIFGWKTFVGISRRTIFGWLSSWN